MKFNSPWNSSRVTTLVVEEERKIIVLKLRYIKKYKEANIRTNRLYNSAIPYMQRYLNSEHMKTERKIS